MSAFEPGDTRISVIDGYPTFAWEKNTGLTVVCAYLCPWDEFPSLVDWLQGKQIEFAGSPLRAKWEMETTKGVVRYNAVECTKVNVSRHSGTPRVGLANSVVGPRYTCVVKGEDALARVEATFETVTRTHDPAATNPPDGSTVPHPGGNGQPSMRIKYFATYGGETMVLEGRGFEWTFDAGNPVAADVSIASHQTIIDHHIVLENAPRLPLFADGLYNKVNSDTFTIPLINRSVAPNKLLFMGYSPSQEYLVSADGAVYAQGWTLEFVIRERPLRWDVFWNPDIQDFDIVDPHPFETAAFGNLFRF